MTWRLRLCQAKISTKKKTHWNLAGDLEKNSKIRTFHEL